MSESIIHNDQSVRAYANGIRDLFEADSDSLISNGEHEHAKALYTEFFKNAKKEVRMLCSELKAVCFDDTDLVEAAKAAIKNNKVKLLILVQQDKSIEPSAFLNMLKETETPIYTSERAKKVKQNFCVMDHKSFRIEPDREKPQAVASVNRPDIAEELWDTFTRLLMGREEIARCNP